MNVTVVVPSDIDDTAAPSGGNVYDRRVCDGLAAAGWSVREHLLTGAWPWPDADARDALAGALAEVPDGGVVLLDGLVACGVPDALIREAHRLRLVVLVHLPLGDEVGNGTLAALEREALHAASAVVATSPWTARRIADVHDIVADRIHVAPPGTEPAPAADGTDGASRLLCVGAITRTKGQDLLVEALARVADLRWSCDLVGPLWRDPAQVTAVRGAIELHRLSNRIRLTGPRTGSQLAGSFAAADLLVLPSRAEAYGMVAAEAIAREIPVLAMAVGGVPETLDGGGLLVPPDNVDDLAAALRRWFTEPALRDELRSAARKRKGSLEGWEVTTRCLSTVLSGMRG